MKWSKIDTFLNEGLISRIGYLFVETYLEKNVDPECIALFLIHLFHTTKEGHICITLKGGKLYPPPNEIFSSDSEKKEIFQVFSAEVHKGSQLFKTFIQEKGSDFPVIYYENSVYLQRNWVYESFVVQNIENLFMQKLDEKVDPISFHKMLDEDPELFSSQKEAIKKAFSQSFSIILGGPGTGKTYTASKLISLFTSALKDPNYRIAIAAPTGKAASNLLEKIHKIDKSHLIDPKTLHRLLDIHPGKSKDFVLKTLPYDLILIDEASMIDIRFLSYLLCSIKKGSRVVFLGDDEQLPPVDSGCIFPELAKIDLLTSLLDTYIRFDSKELYAFSLAVKEQNIDRIEKILNSSNQVVTLLPLDTDLLLKVESFYVQENSIEKAVENLSKFRLLSCIRQGPYGVDRVNQIIHNRMLEKYRFQKSFYYPILITENKHVKQIYNGMQGIMYSTYKENKIVEDAYFYDESSPNFIKKISKYELPAYELGYCISVHKSQGSEYEEVLLLMSESSEVFGREILYTAATRAKKRMKIISSMDIIKKTVKRQNTKNCRIRERIKLQNQRKICKN